MKGDVHEQIEGLEARVYAALVLGTRDYVGKCGFQNVIVGLSGGIDSALTAAIAVDALGAENVLGVGMPSPYSSRGSIDDARELAANLGIRFELLRITNIFEASPQTFTPAFTGYEEHVTAENLQTRIRGTMPLGLSHTRSTERRSSM